jgi:peptidoglycan DL-endopeptidase RipA
VSAARHISRGMSRGMKLGAAVAALATSVALTPTPALGLPNAHHAHHHTPSPAQIARSKRIVDRRVRQVRIAEAAVSRAKQQLVTLSNTAEVAFEAYDGAEVKLKAAQHAVSIAHQVLAGANRQVTAGQNQVAAFATQAYESGGLTSLDTYFGAGGPAQLVARVGAVDAISNTEHQTLQHLQAAKIYHGVVSRQTEVVASRATAAAVVASRAKAIAAAAVSAQTTVLDQLNGKQAQLRTLLANAQAHASKLEKARLAALARARAAAAAAARRAAAAAAAASAAAGSPPGPFSGSSGSTAGTVSAATAATAVADAESQIGKPYQWAAAGPNTFDCSGLTMWAYDQVGVHLDHWTHDQWNEGAHISRADLRPGDLVFFALNIADPSTIHHVGMYVGNDEMVDAPFTGVDVRYDSIDRPDYIGAVRPY